MISKTFWILGLQLQVSKLFLNHLNIFFTVGQNNFRNKILFLVPNIKVLLNITFKHELLCIGPTLTWSIFKEKYSQNRFRVKRTGKYLYIIQITVPFLMLIYYLVYLLPSFPTSCTQFYTDGRSIFFFTLRGKKETN